MLGGKKDARKEEECQEGGRMPGGRQDARREEECQEEKSYLQNRHPLSSPFASASERTRSKGPERTAPRRSMSSMTFVTSRSIVTDKPEGPRGGVGWRWWLWHR